MNSVSEDELTSLLNQWRELSGPLGQRLGTRLIELIDQGLVPDGVRLPPERTLATRLGISRTTVTAAYRHARRAGRVTGRQGSGHWAARPEGAVTVTPSQAAFGTLGRPAGEVLDLSLAETRCADLTRSALSDLDPGWLAAQITGTGYHPQGLLSLRVALAEYLAGTGSRGPAGLFPRTPGASHGAGLNITPDDLLITTGAQQAISVSAAALAPPGSTVLVEEATYPGALEAFRHLGLRVLPLPTDEQGPDPAALEVLATRTRAALVYLVPVGNNPTGVIIPPARLEALAEVLTRIGVPLLEDRTAALLAEPEATPAPLASRLAPGRAVLLGSMSKVAWAGLRVGWVSTTGPLLREILGVRLATDLAGSALAQAVATVLVPRLPDLAAAVRAGLRLQQRTLGSALDEYLPEWLAPAPQAAAWRWVRLAGDARAVAAAGTGHGVIVTPGPAFSPQAALTDHLRISVTESPERIVEGVRRLAEAWRSARHWAPQTPRARGGLLI